MSDWKAELDALVAKTTAFVKEIHGPREEPAPTGQNPIQLIGLRSIILQRTEREEIRTRVRNFQVHQLRLIREREEYAASVLSKMREATPLVASMARVQLPRPTPKPLDPS